MIGFLGMHISFSTAYKL